MKVSLLVPWREDPERRRLLDWVRGRWGFMLPHAEFVYGHSPDGPFNRGAALNDAARKATGDVFILADADTAAIHWAVSGCLAWLELNPQTWALPYERYYNLSREFTEWLLAHPPTTDYDEPTRGSYEHRLTDSVSGVVVVPRPAWEAVHGFDERFVGWGGEDRAFQSALNVLWGPCVRSKSFVMHLWHEAPETVRFLNPNWPTNEALMKQYQQAGVDEMLELVNR